MILGRIEPRAPLTIIGGGIAGLLLARAQLRHGGSVRLLERGSRLGGLLETRNTPYGPAEAAAHSLLATPAVLDLCRELGIELIEARTRTRYIVRGQKLRRLPAPALTPAELAAAVWRAATVRAHLPREATLEDWARAHLGEAALNWALDPFTHGIYGVPPRELSLDAAFPRLRTDESALLPHLWRNRRRGARAPAMVAPREGVGALARALEAELRGHPRCEVRLGEQVTTLPSDGAVALCVPAPQAAALLAAAGERALAAALARLRYVALTSVTAFVRGAAGDPPGVGALFPSSERRAGQPLGVLFNSSAFEGRVSSSDFSSFTLIFRSEDTAGAAISALVERSLSFLLKREVSLLHHMAFSHAEAVPIYDSRVRDVWAIAGERFNARPGLALFGNYTGQVSLRGMIEACQDLR